MPEFPNVYDDDERARAYAKLDFPGTYYLAYRDVPALIARHVRGRRALDFGCGTGRSTRFLSRLGLDAVGIDIAAPMLARAREQDPSGSYRLVRGDGLRELPPASFDLVLSMFTFDNVPGMDRKVTIFRSLARLLDRGGRIVSVVSSPEIYVNEWASFSTGDYPENLSARSGDTVRIVMLDVDDRRPVADVLWSDDAYSEVYGRAGLEVLETRRPLATGDEPYNWISETTIAPWVVYVLGATA
jgi:SAM-dependent methyltransferase